MVNFVTICAGDLRVGDIVLDDSVPRLVRSVRVCEVDYVEVLFSSLRYFAMKTMLRVCRDSSVKASLLRGVTRMLDSSEPMYLWGSGAEAGIKGIGEVFSEGHGVVISSSSNCDGRVWVRVEELLTLLRVLDKGVVLAAFKALMGDKVVLDVDLDKGVLFIRGASVGNGGTASVGQLWFSYFREGTWNSEAAVLARASDLLAGGVHGKDGCTVFYSDYCNNLITLNRRVAFLRILFPRVRFVFGLCGGLEGSSLNRNLRVE